MSDEVAEASIATEASVAASIAKQYGAMPAAAAAPEPAAAVETFPYDASYQTKIAGLAIRDQDFMAQVAHLLKPEYFEHGGEAALVNTVLRYHQKYGRVPDTRTLAALLKDDRQAKIIRDELWPLVSEAFKATHKVPLSDIDFAADKVAEFARHQAVGQAIYDSVGLRERKQWDKVERLMQEALSIGKNIDGGMYDYWKTIDQRTDIRLEKAAGKLPPTGITTGITVMNDKLYHRGWGRKELSVIMGGPKTGKSMGLLNFAKYASIGGKSVLYVTLELSKDIASDRLDAAISETLMSEIAKNVHGIRSKIEKVSAKAGILNVCEYPTGTLSPAMLHALIRQHKAKGMVYDLVVVDYADIMCPNNHSNEARENSRLIWIGLRAIAMVENLAMLTATQTNRDGYMATVAKAEHVADDFNKIRTADLVISINASEDERKRNEARLYFAASRNQEGDFTLLVRQNRAKMQFIEAVLSVE
jgi:replicative DNA helicase